MSDLTFKLIGRFFFLTSPVRLANGYENLNKLIDSMRSCKVAESYDFASILCDCVALTTAFREKSCTIV